MIFITFLYLTGYINIDWRIIDLREEIVQLPLFLFLFSGLLWPEVVGAPSMDGGVTIV